MSEATVIRRLRSELEVLSASGQTHVPIAQFDKWFANLEELSVKDPETFDTVLSERFKANNELILASLHNRSQQDLELLRSLVSTSGSAAKTSLLINGGSAVALLAFIGHLVTTGNSPAIRLFALPLGFFATGVFFAALASSIIYFVQWRFYHQKSVARARWAAIVAHGLAFASFGAGCLGSLCGFMALGK